MRNVIIAILGIALLIILINNFNLEAKVNERDVKIIKLESELKEYETLNSLALKKAKDDEAIISDGVDRITSNYKPVKEYIIKYKGSNNDECKDANELINNTIY